MALTSHHASSPHDAPSATVLSKSLRIAWLLATALVVVLAVLLTADIGERSLWVDELATAWVTDDSLTQALHRAYITQGHSGLYYALIWIVRAVCGSSEITLRSASLLAVGMCAVYLYCFARRLGWSESQGLAALGLFSAAALPSPFLGSLARPHALATLAVVASVLHLHKWREVGRRGDAVAYVFAVLLTLYLHYLFVPVLLLHLCLVAPWNRRCSGVGGQECRPTLRSLRFVAPREIGLVLLVGALLLPGFFHLRLLWKKREIITWAAPANLSALYSQLVPHELLSVLLVFPVVWFLDWRTVRWRLRDNRLTLLLAWVLVAPCFFFALSFFQVSHHFTPQLFVWRIPGAVLLVALLVTTCRSQVIGICAMVALSLVFLLHHYEQTRPLMLEDWRGAVRALEQTHTPEAYLIYPALIEQGSLDWLTDPLRRSYFSHPLRHYLGRERPMYVAPLWLAAAASRESAHYWLQEQQQLLQYRRAGVVCTPRYELQGKTNCALLLRDLVRKGFAVQKRYRFGAVEATYLVH